MDNQQYKLSKGLTIMKVLRQSIVKVGINRGTKRLWLEGKWLHNCGFVKGDHYNVFYGHDEIILTWASNGSNLVSGKKGDKSVIDLNNASVGKSIPLLHANLVACYRHITISI